MPKNRMLSTVLVSTAFVSAAFLSSPAFAEKSAEQIKCEEEGGSWVDKGEGHTFCFKKLPGKAKGNPTHGTNAGSNAQGQGKPKDKPQP